MIELSRLGPHILGRLRKIPFLLYGMLAVSAGILTYLIGIFMVLPRYLFGLNQLLLPLNELIVWYSGMPVMLGFVFILIDLFLLLGTRRRRESVRYLPASDPHV